MRKLCIALGAGLILALGAVATASADPAFGPGNGQQNGDKCHPPGQTEDVPGCK